MEARTAANCSEERKSRKNAALAEAHQFEPIAVEMIEVCGGSTAVILRAIGRCLVEATGKPWKAYWLCENLAIAIQLAMRSVFSQSVERAFRGSGKSRIHFRRCYPDFRLYLSSEV